MVSILLGKGFEEAEALVPADLLRRAGVEVALVGLEDRQVTGSHGVTVMADLLLEELDESRIELLMLPGGLGGVESIRVNRSALGLIQRCWERGCWLAAICAAPTILAQLGILDRRKAVCFPGMEEQMGSAAVQRGAGVVVDGHLITGQAAGASFDFGLKLVEVLKGSAAAVQVRNGVHYRC